MTRKVFIDELSNILEEMNVLNDELSEEMKSHKEMSLAEVKFFLNQFGKGKITDYEFKKSLIHTLINKVNIYEDKLTIFFNVKNGQGDVETSLVKNVNFLNNGT